MALTLKVSELLDGLHHQAVNQAEDGNLTDEMAAKIIRIVRELGFNFTGRKSGSQEQDLPRQVPAGGSEESP